ncbi:hypothetical protein CMEL01_01583 [Colletotrichum melonis]|uniref:Uncharacterized protein n=1 Tax=Colletotrichum melonis TaxID=1209925 RepID=A0AAI9V3B4_9PEZI|nr:hypothetical protein CMEL01_01583 [Colletotrichum melonis]
MVFWPGVEQRQRSARQNNQKTVAKKEPSGTICQMSAGSLP